MALTFRSNFSNKNPISSLIPTHFPKPPIVPPNSRPHVPIRLLFTFTPRVSPLRNTSAASSGDLYGQIDGNNEFNLDDLLSILEFFSLTFSAAISLYVAVGYGVQKGAVFGLGRSKIYAWQCVVMTVSVVIGAVIRRRQWRRVCGAGFSKGAGLLRRVERVEEDLRNSATLIRVLSRQLEKLGIRVRDTRKALKEPVSKTAALAQKNSEVTRVLAAQEDVLENELSETQKVLLAMQEQQQKQLELILAIGKTGNLFNTQPSQTNDLNRAQTSNSPVDGGRYTGIDEIEILRDAKASQ